MQKPRGKRGDFLKITITMDPELLYEIHKISLKRRSLGKKDTDISSLIRESVNILIKLEAHNDSSG